MLRNKCKPGTPDNLLCVLDIGLGASDPALTAAGERGSSLRESRSECLGQWSLRKAMEFYEARIQKDLSGVKGS